MFQMELSFTVPFITIPVKKTMEATKGALANVNFGAILISGVILLAISVAAPFVSYLVSKKGSKNDDRRNRSKIFVHITYVYLFQYIFFTNKYIDRNTKHTLTAQYTYTHTFTRLKNKAI